jgi:protein phosphatase
MSDIEDTVELTPRPPFEIAGYGMTDRGRRRETNEDCFAVAEMARALRVHHTNLPQSKTNVSPNRAYVYLVADGVGGSEAGEVASELSVETIEDFLLNTLRRFSNLQADEEQGALLALQDALRQADSRIFEETAEHPEWLGMGTTLTMAFAVNWRLFVAHAGDSRCYLFSGGELQQLTEDHTMRTELERRGLTVAAERWRHVVTNILGGPKPGVQVELHNLELHPGDTLLLCSDGLTEMVSEEEIAAVLERERDPRQACERLVEEANRLGGRDNITVIVARVCAGEV